MKEQNLQDIKNVAALMVDAVKKTVPLVHCVTNVVTVNDCANILLAFGASPAMIDAQEEAYDFAGISGAVYINFGTFHQGQESGAVAAALGAKQARRPIVIDPVGCAAIPRRAALVERFYRIAGMDVIKGNMGEIMALAGGAGTGVKGVDSADAIPGIEEAAIALARRYSCVVAATGKVDVVTDGRRLIRLHNGVHLLKKITGAGCMAGALCAATASVARDGVTGGDMLAAVAAAITAVSVAGELAAEKTALPGSFRAALLDSVYGLTGQTVIERGVFHGEYLEQAK
jgi:hydroxyethylthiazole kinase